MSWRFTVPPTPPASFADAVTSNAEAHVGIGFTPPTPTSAPVTDEQGQQVFEQRVNPDGTPALDAEGKPQMQPVTKTVMVETHYAKFEQIAQLRLLAAGVAKLAQHLHESGQLGAISALSADIRGHAVPGNDPTQGHETISMHIIGSSAHGQPPA